MRNISTISGVMANVLSWGRINAQRAFMTNPTVNMQSSNSGAVTGQRIVAPAHGMFLRKYISPAFESENDLHSSVTSADSVPARTWKAPNNNIKFPGNRVSRGVQHGLLEKYLSKNCMSAMEVNKMAMKESRDDFKRHDRDCGSTEVQVAALTTKIDYMVKHLLVHRKDHSSRRGLHAMLDTRKKLLRYLRRTDGDRYGDTIFRLNLRDNVNVTKKEYLSKTKKKNKNK